MATPYVQRRLRKHPNPKIGRPRQVTDTQITAALPGSTRTIGERVNLERSAIYLRLCFLEHDSQVTRVRQAGMDWWRST